MQSPMYLKWIIEETGTVFEDDIPLTCYTIDYSQDHEILEDWALHIRKHYIGDEDLAESMMVLDITAEEYLREFVVPQKNDVLGPTSRSNDITEILISDLLEYVFNYSVPRCKQLNRSGKSQSEHGTDVIAYKYRNTDKKPSLQDELITAEVKAQLTSISPDVIFSAVKDSYKDEQRYAHTLDYYRKKLKYLGKIAESQEVARFQMKTEKDYKFTIIGAAISSQETITNKIVMGISGDQLELKSNQKVFYLHGKKLMDLTHEIYERCIK